MIGKCPRQTELKKHFLSDGTPDDLSGEDKAHFASCSACQSEWDRFQKFESGMQMQVKKSLAGVPGPGDVIMPADITVKDSFLRCLMSSVNAKLAVGAVLSVFALFFIVFRTEKSPDVHHAVSIPYVETATVSKGVFNCAKKRYPENSIITLSDDSLNCFGQAALRLPNDIELQATNALFKFTDKGIAIKYGKVDVSVKVKGTSFYARTSSIVLGVRGTRFIVDVTESGETSVEVLSGEVAAESVKNGQFRLLKPGDKIKVTAAGNFEVSEIPPSVQQPDINQEPAPVPQLPVTTSVPETTVTEPLPDQGGTDGIFGND